MAKTTTKAKKATPTPPATTPDKRTLKAHELVLSPTIQSAVAIEAWSKFAGTVDLAELVDDLRERIKKVQGGDMQPVEAMLFGQAMTLETIFTSLARRATSQEYLKQFQTYLGLALKAQAQCRATLADAVARYGALYLRPSGQTFGSAGGTVCRALPTPSHPGWRYALAATGRMGAGARAAGCGGVSCGGCLSICLSATKARYGAVCEGRRCAEDAASPAAHPT